MKNEHVQKKSYSQVTRGTLKPTASTIGRIDALNPVLILTQVSGRLKAIKVLPGQKLIKNQLIAQLDNPSLLQAMEKFHQEFSSALNAYKREEISQDIKKIAIQKEVQSAQQSLNILLLKSKANTVLLKKHLISELDYNIFKLNLKQAQDLLSQTKKEQELIKNIMIKELEAAKRKVTLAQQRLDVSRNRVEALNILAPSSGTVLEISKSLKLGKLLSAGELLLSFYNKKNLMVKMQLPPETAQKVFIGDTVDITVDSKKFNAKINAIEQQVSQGTVSVWAAITSENITTLKPNQDVQVIIHQKVLNNVLLLPRPIWCNSVDDIIILDTSEQQHRIPNVKLGQIDDHWVQVVTGLKKDDKVIMLSKNTH